MTNLASIAKEIRVPELRYQVVDAGAVDAAWTGLIDSFLDSIREASDLGVMEFINQNHPDVALSPEHFNFCFLADRIFDVWCRKSKLDPNIIALVSPWRFLFVAILWHEKDAFSDLSHPLVQLLNSLSDSQLGWTQYPERAARPLLELLSQLNESLATKVALEPDYIAVELDKFRTFVSQQQGRRTKVVTRLMQTEQGLSNQFYGEQKARNLLNRLFAGHDLPVSLTELLQNDWLKVLHKAFVDQSKTEDIEIIEDFTHQLALAFIKKGPNLIKIADTVVDSFNQYSSQYSVEINPELIQKLQQDLIELLQKHAVSLSTFETLETQLDLNQSYSDLDMLKGEWFFREEGEHASRVQCAEIMQHSNELLFLNHVGVKTTKITVEILRQQKSSGILRPIGRPYEFSQVIIDALKGLSKVANAQREARLKAAEKARAEAAALEAERQESERKAQVQAEEIARRAAEMKQQQEQRVRAAQESQILKQLTTMQLGAWIEVVGTDAPGNYKLVVRLNATSKYIFVDKLGVKRFEIKQDQLIEKIIQDEIRILSEGAEFEDMLERVVGRMRINNK